MPQWLSRPKWFWLIAGIAVIAVLAFGACKDEEREGKTPTGETPSAGITPATGPTALKIGGLFDFTGALAEFGPPIRNGAAMGIADCNAAGGIGGDKVEMVEADAQTSATAGVDAANQLIDVEGAHVILGPMASGVTAAVAESVTVPGGIVLISPSATAPTVAEIEDDDFVFRTTVSDLGQGGILAQLADDLGYTKVGVLYGNNPYGQGLAEVFKEKFEALGGGRSVTTVPYDEKQASYLAELQQATAGGVDAFAAIGYPTEAQVYVREAIENELVEPGKFLFVDGTQSKDLIAAVGAESLNGSSGTAPGQAPTTAQRQAFVALYEAEYGAFPPTPFIAEAYDAAALFCLAAAHPDPTDGATFRDALREVSSPPGEKVGPGVEGLAKALQLIAAGTDVDYEGWASSTNFDENGDVLQGSIQLWEIKDGVIADKGAPISVDLAAGG
ncbi:MAG TPA: ABC transporter substrate-binding protein [Dehalococcoidia bacterium]|nr:ABC transporter substrate-binding protein [Dehalococcoidia bacterium]